MSAEMEYVPLDVLKRMLDHSAKQLAEWERSMSEHQKGVDRAERMIKHWQDEMERQSTAIELRTKPRNPLWRPGDQA